MRTWLLRNIALAVGTALIRYALRAARRRRNTRKAASRGRTA
jgi:hypothetical protein